MGKPGDATDVDTADPSKLSIGKIFGQLTTPQLAGVVSASAAVLGVAFYLGSRLDPDLLALKAENSRLTATLAGVEVDGGKARELSLETFIAKTQAETSGLEALHAGRLFAPRLPEPWLHFRGRPAKPGQAGNAAKAANDLTLLAEAADLPEQSIKELFPSMWAFNEKNPPLLWTLERTPAEPLFGTWFPYIQVSVITREDAQELMQAVSRDSSSILPETLNRIRNPFHKQLSQDGQTLFDQRLDRFIEPANALHAFITSSFSADERASLFASLGKTEEARNAQLTRLTGEAVEAATKQFEVPTRLVMNGMNSLSEVTPESGLLLGRLLFYVFASSGQGRVDIEYLTVGYSGSYARTRRTIQYAPPNGEVRNTYVFDHILILATKSDFCLVHIRVPHLSDRLRDVDTRAQAWMRQLRLREFR